MEKIALVTGGNKGLGYECCKILAEKGYIVILASRDLKKGKEAAKIIKGTVIVKKLDITSEKEQEELVIWIEKEYGKCDILINNAAIFLDEGEGMKEMPYTIENIPLDLIKKTFETNLYGPITLTQKILPLMKKNNFGRIVNVSSVMGQLSDMDAGYPSYRLSKTALNAFTKNLSKELHEYNILVNSVCPGWCRTDMGGPEATRSAKEGAEDIVWLALLPDNGPRGKFFNDKKEISW